MLAVMTRPAEICQPACLVKYQHGLGIGHNGGRYLGKVQRYTFDVAAGHDERRALALAADTLDRDALGNRWCAAKSCLV